jgi:hypothetical protein
MISPMHIQNSNSLRIILIDLMYISCVLTVRLQRVELKMKKVTTSWEEGNRKSQLLQRCVRESAQSGSRKTINISVKTLYYRNADHSTHILSVNAL